MLKCHICQVLNEDDARFCLECGQRFVKATNNNLPAFSATNTSVSPNNPTEIANQPKSLWTQEDFENDDSLKNQKIDFAKESTYNENLNKSDQHFQAKDNMNNFNNSNDDNLTNPKSSKIKLHSPLLGNDDDDDYPNTPNNKTNFSGKQNLHSPLLGNDDDDDDDYQNTASNKTNFSGKQKLHSPLLGNDDNDDYAYSGQRNNLNNKSKLNSPLLRNNNVENDYEDEPVFEEINDPNVLRSPLLLSKIHTNETKQTSTNLNKVNPQNPIDSGKIQSPKPQVDNYNTGQVNPEIINSSKPENTGTLDQISTNIAQTNPQFSRPGFSEPEYNTKLIKPDSSPKTNINLPLNSAARKTSQTLPSANLSQITNEVEAEIDNSKNYRSRTTKPPKLDNYSDKPTNQSLQINRILFVMIFIALLAKLGYIILTFIQQPASLNNLFIINEFAQLLLFTSCLMAINTLSK